MSVLQFWSRYRIDWDKRNGPLDRKRGHCEEAALRFNWSRRVRVQFLQTHGAENMAFAAERDEGRMYITTKLVVVWKLKFTEYMSGASQTAQRASAGVTSLPLSPSKTVMASHE